MKSGWRSLAARIALLFATLAIMIGIFELGLRALGFEAIYDVYSKPSVLWRHDPLVGWHHEPNHRERYVGPRPWPIEFETEIEINSLGLRGPELETLLPGGKRVLFLGDSVVAGFEVPYESTFVALLADRLTAELGDPVQTINGGVRGWGTDQSLLYFQRQGRGLGADLVVFLHSHNDFRNNMTLHRRRRPFGKAAFGVVSEPGASPRGSVSKLELRGVPIPDYPLCVQVVLDSQFQVERIGSNTSRLLCELETRLADHSALFTLVAMRLRQNRELLYWLRGLGGTDLGPPPGAEKPEEREPVVPAEEEWLLGGLRLLESLGPGAAWAEAPVEQVQERAKPKAARFVLAERLMVELAREVRLSGAELVIVMNRTQRERIDEAAILAEGAEVVSLPFPKEEAAGRAWQWVNDGHFNEWGHELAARSLAPVLGERLRSP